MKIIFFLLFTSQSYAALDPNSLLRDAEKIRNPKVSYLGKIKITDERPDAPADVRTYKVSSKANGTSLVEYLTPPNDAGTKVLMVEDDMWVVLPNAAKPMRVAPKNKVVGNAAYGDIATISYEENYVPSIKGGGEFEGKKVHILDLKAKEGKAVTYDRIEYWLEQSTSRPVKALYMTSSGKILREGIFTGYRQVLGVERPMILILKNQLDQKLTTKIEFVSAEQKKFADSLFEKSSLK